MDKADFAKSLFHGVEKYNCAQAIMAAFKDECGVSDERIVEHKANGGGRAPEGVCGAAYAALELLDDSVHTEATEKFTAAAKYMGCHQIKKSQSLPCKDCVGVAAEIVEHYL